MDEAQLRRKYPKWAHRRDFHKRKRKRAVRRVRRHRRRSRRAHRARAKSHDVTTILLTQLLHQIMGVGTVPLARKHGENVITGYAGGVAPDLLAPVRSRSEYLYPAPKDRAGLTGVAVGAAASAGPRAPMPD